MKFQIVVDSSSDLTKEYINRSDIKFNIAPLSINIDKQTYIDDEKLDIKQMLDAMNQFKQKSTSSCPAVGLYEDYFRQAEYTFCVTISSKLSGSFNSASSAKQIVMEEGKNHIHVIDSKAVSGVEILIVDELVQLIDLGLSFEEICQKIDAYVESTNLLFVLSKFDNLIKNGRMNKFVGMAASLFSIKPLCVADDGEIKIFKKIRTLRHAHSSLIEEIGTRCPNQKGRKLIITHVYAEELANKMKKTIEDLYNFDEVVVINARGLCSFYALEEGIIVCF